MSFETASAILEFRLLSVEANSLILFSMLINADARVAEALAVSPPGVP